MIKYFIDINNHVIRQKENCEMEIIGTDAVDMGVEQPEGAPDTILFLDCDYAESGLKFFLVLDSKTYGFLPTEKFQKDFAMRLAEEFDRS